MEINDDGYAEVTIRSADGEAVTVTVDVFAVLCEVVDITQRHPRGQAMGAWTEAVIEYMVRLGFPPVSHLAAARFAEAIMLRAGELKKKEAGAGSPGPGSPASTGSTPTN